MNLRFKRLSRQHLRSQECHQAWQCCSGKSSVPAECMLLSTGAVLQPVYNVSSAAVSGQASFTLLEVTLQSEAVSIVCEAPVRRCRKVAFACSAAYIQHRAKAPHRRQALHPSAL